VPALFGTSNQSCLGMSRSRKSNIIRQLQIFSEEKAIVTNIFVHQEEI
jgi:hypothetical protein